MAEQEEKTGERLAKRIARAGICSRREAEKLIEAGRVQVDGKKITSPALNVTAEQKVRIDGEEIPEAESTRVWLYHKPAGLVTTHRDPQGRPTVFDMLDRHLPRVISVGRLDLNTEGLLVLTNDGELARHLEHPSTGWVRRYRVRAHGPVNQKMIAQLAQGITVEGVTYEPIQVTIEREGTNRWLMVSLTEGKNREIRRVFKHFDCEVSRLIRVSYGPFQLGGLEKGQFKEVSKKALVGAVGNKKLKK